jgi:hypothetical protein
MIYLGFQYSQQVKKKPGLFTHWRPAAQKILSQFGFVSWTEWVEAEAARLTEITGKAYEALTATMVIDGRVGEFVAIAAAGAFEAA